MPQPSSTGSVLRWPSAEAVGVFGSYARGDAGVGSDLDLLLILRHCHLPQWNPAFATVLARDVRWLVGP